MAGRLLLFELKGPFGAGGELAQSGERRRFSLAQFGEDLIDDAIQLVGGFGAGDARLAGHAFGDFRFPHAGSILAGQIGQFRLKRVLNVANILQTNVMGIEPKGVNGFDADFGR
jgi:hypothetical protein